MKRLPHSVLLLISCFLAKPTTAIWPFPKKRFEANALIDAGSLGLDGVRGRLIAFGDFDGDQFLDVVSLSEDQQTITIHQWNHDDFIFSNSRDITIGKNVVNVVPGDFNRDGRLDLLVMSESRTMRGALDMALYLSGRDGFVRDPVLLPPSSNVQPLAIDSSGAMKIDLLGFSMSPNGEANAVLWNNTRTDPKVVSEPFFQLTDTPFNDRLCAVSNPHSNAVVDFDGDCLADIFVMCGTVQKSYQIWTNHKEKGFELARSGSFPPNIGPVSFADMDRDGTIDMVFATCSSISDSTGIGKNCKINIVYNKQIPLCESNSQTLAHKGKCRMPDALCSSDPNFEFDFHQGSGSDVGFTSIEVSSLFKDGSDSLLLYDTTASPSVPVPLRIGDLDLDAFPDIVPIVVHKDGSTTPHILISHPCASGINGCHGPVGRSFKALVKNTEALTKIKDARAIALLDIDEDGTWDLMVQRTGKQSGARVSFVQNNFFHDAFFMKAIVLNGACNGLCTPENASDPKYHPFGVSYSGPTYKYTVLDTSGRRSAAQVNQLPQTSYQALHTPYAFFGLGRTNNYVENLFVGSTKHQPQHYINMEGVIPNSRVVIIPPGRSDVESMGDWRRELYLRPGEWIPWVTFTVVVATMFLAVIVMVLHFNEKREDELERRRKLHHINFDAL